MKSLSVFNDADVLKASLDKTAKDYKLYDPGWYLYRMIVNFNGSKLSSDFIQLVYVTLCAWNMNSRGARLSNYDDFEASILLYGDIFFQLEKWRICDLYENAEVKNLLEVLFFNLTLVAPGKPMLVTASKTLHFFLPNLIVPVDRKYTLNYFNGHTNINGGMENQFSLFFRIQQEFSRFSTIHNLENYMDERWSLSIPKVIDNMIIGYMKL